MKDQEARKVLNRHEKRIIEMSGRLTGLDHKVEMTMEYRIGRLERAMEEVLGKLDALAEFEYVGAHWEITDRPAWQKGDHWEAKEKE